MGSEMTVSAVEREKVNKRSIGEEGDLTVEEKKRILSKFFDYEALAELGEIKITGDIISPLCKWADE